MIRARNSLTRPDLWSLEQYAERRQAFREEVLLHKKHRKILLGEHLRLIFEDRLTIQYQIQEMLRIEKIFEADAIQQELDAYNPLIPDGANWKCTLLIQYEDVEQRKVRLTQLLGIEDQIWVQVGDCAPVFAIADEDMERANEEKTAAVHFLRFQLNDDQLAAARGNQALTFGVNHPAYLVEPVKVADENRASLLADISR
ncbi:MAG: DUF3501 family protein [bacterium]|nr:DUF3501 family protein [Gammaproteobacteria bacterium]HIL97859.1 DUF3501 family protein [Pseudomonadales bacterium]